MCVHGRFSNIQSQIKVDMVYFEWLCCDLCDLSVALDFVLNLIFLRIVGIHWDSPSNYGQLNLTTMWVFF